MALLIYNMTATPQVLANGVMTKIPASSNGAGLRGVPWRASGNEMRGRSAAEYVALESQRARGIFSFVWETYPEYDTGALQVATFFSDMQYQMVQAQLAANTKPPIDVKVANFEPALYTTEEGQPRDVKLYEKLPYSVRIISVSGVVTRGAPGAEMYVCCHPDGLHDPHTERFDMSLAGGITEKAVSVNRIIKAGEDVYVYVSSGYVLASIVVLFQPI